MMASARLSKVIRRWMIGIGVGVWVTGGGWLIAHYWLADPLALPGSSAAEPWWLKLHGAFAFLSIWMAGLIFGKHVMHSWGQHRRRWSGGLLLAGLSILIASGYLLYYVGGEASRSVISGVHWILGLALPIGYLAHRVIHRVAARRLRGAIYK